VKAKDLVIGETYWIMSGGLVPVAVVLSEIDERAKVAMFGGIARYIKNVYKTEEEAKRIGRY